MKLTKLQKNIIDSNAPKIAIEACAASLKTATLTEKVRKLLKDGNAPTSIVVITFTRMAAAELIARLGEDYREGLFVGTIHSLAARILSIRGYGEEVNKIAEREDFDKLFELCSLFDIQNLYDWVLVDECQDTGINELKFIFEMLKPSHYFVVYDRRQSIYGFKGARPDVLMTYVKDATFFSLNENYRNGANILAYAKRIIRSTGLTDTSIPMRDIAGVVYEKPYSLNTIYTEIKKDPNYNKWAILTRTNAEVLEISSYLTQKNIPNETFRQGDLKRDDLLERLKNNSVKVLTTHSSKGLSFDKVIVVGMRFYSLEEYNICYVAATRARDLLIWMTAPRKTRRNYKS